MVPTYSQSPCRACNGSGFQTNRDGIKVKCPVCNGTGIEWTSNMDNLPPGIWCYYSETSPKGKYFGRMM